jgi:HTH-type transcriptional regulator/antitoxin HigA
MSDIVKRAVEHWPLVAWLLKRPESEAEYNLLAESRYELLAMMGGEELHPLENLVEIIGDHIEAYDHERRPVPV